MSDKKELTIIQEINKELVKQTSHPDTMRALMATTFKGFESEQLVKQACLEAMMNGYTFQDLIQKKIYAIPYGEGYSLVQSIEDVRATAMHSGQVGKSAPVFEDNKNGTIKSCTVTVKRKVGDYVGDYTATVFFTEYDKGRDSWKSKPRTMIAKVAEMHALRSAFPVELAKAYIEDEFRDDTARFTDAVRESKSLSMGNFVKNHEQENDQENQEQDHTEQIGQVARNNKRQ